MALAVSHGVGRRKEAVARVWMKSGKGKILINGKDYKDYFPTEGTRKDVELPLKTVEKNENFDIKIRVCGGGYKGQASAVKLGIARALLAESESFRQNLKAEGLLSVDGRVKERKKPGQPGARKKFQFVKR